MMERLANIAMLVSAALVPVMLALVIFSVNEYADLPEVWISNESGACVKVLVEDRDVGCESLTKFDKYVTVWVK